MKKILFLILVASAFAVAVKAQVTFSPPSFTAQDSVTLTVDVTGTPMAGQTEAFIWIFSNVSGGGKDGFTNTSWSNSPEVARMVNVGTNQWRFGFIGTTMFGQTPADLKDFGFLLKAKDGSKQTSDYKPYKFDPLIFTPSKLRVFPAKVDVSDVVTVNFDRSFGDNVNELRMTPTTATISAYDDAGTQVGTNIAINVNQTLGGSIWSASFIPNISFVPSAGRTLKTFRYKFNGTVLDATGVAATVTTSEAEVSFIPMK